MIDHKSKIFGARLKSWLREHGMISDETVASYCNWSSATMSRTLNGKRTVSEDDVDVLLDRLSLSSLRDWFYPPEYIDTQKEDCIRVVHAFEGFLDSKRVINAAMKRLPTSLLNEVAIKAEVSCLHRPGSKGYDQAIKFGEIRRMAVEHEPAQHFDVTVPYKNFVDMFCGVGCWRMLDFEKMEEQFLFLRQRINAGLGFNVFISYATDDKFQSKFDGVNATMVVGEKGVIRRRDCGLALVNCNEKQVTDTDAYFTTIKKDARLVDTAFLDELYFDFLKPREAGYALHNPNY